VKKRTDSIAVTLLGEYVFCPYAVYLQEVKGFRPRPTQAMRDGSKAHAERTKLLLLATKSISIKDALLKAESGIVTIKKEFMVTGKTLRGRIDEIVIGKNEITIIDNKPRPRAYESSIHQVWAYCCAFAEEHNPRQPIYGEITNYRTEKGIWREPFSVEQGQKINDLINKIQAIKSLKIPPVVDAFPEKCQQCGFYDYCRVKAV
jgi:CRISPR-associated protein Cas4